MENFKVTTYFYETEKPKCILVFNYHYFYSLQEVVNYVVSFGDIKSENTNASGKWNIKLKIQ